MTFLRFLFTTTILKHSCRLPSTKWWPLIKITVYRSHPTNTTLTLNKTYQSDPQTIRSLNGNSKKATPTSRTYWQPVSSRRPGSQLKITWEFPNCWKKYPPTAAPSLVAHSQLAPALEASCQSLMFLTSAPLHPKCRLAVSSAWEHQSYRIFSWRIKETRSVR